MEVTENTWLGVVMAEVAKKDEPGDSNSWGIGSIMGNDGENRRVLNRYGR